MRRQLISIKLLRNRWMVIMAILVVGTAAAKNCANVPSHSHPVDLFDPSVAATASDLAMVTKLLSCDEKILNPLKSKSKKLGAMASQNPFFVSMRQKLVGGSPLKHVAAAIHLQALLEADSSVSSNFSAEWQREWCERNAPDGVPAGKFLPAPSSPDLISEMYELRYSSIEIGRRLAVKPSTSKNLSCNAVLKDFVVGAGK